MPGPWAPGVSASGESALPAANTHAETSSLHNGRNSSVIITAKGKKRESRLMENKVYDMSLN